MLAGCIVTGKVTDENGEGVACIRVTLSGNQSRTTYTDGEGKYRFGDLQNGDIIPEGNYTITPSKSGYIFTPVSTEIAIDSQLYPDSEISYVPSPVLAVDFGVMTEIHGDVYRMCELTVKLKWETSPRATGYRIHYSVDGLQIGTGPPYNGTEAVEGASPVDIGKETTFTLHIAGHDGIRFAMTAYNQYGESSYTEEFGIRPWPDPIPDDS